MAWVHEMFTKLKRTTVTICTIQALQTKLAEGSLEVKIPTIWTDGKAEVGRVREEKERIRKIREEKGRRKKVREKKDSETKVDAGVRKDMFWGLGGSKSRLAKVVRSKL